MKKLLLTAIVGTLACGTAVADRWAWSSINDDSTFIQAINLDSAECQGKICSAWVASVSVSLANDYDLMQDLLEIDCKKMKMKSLFTATFRKGAMLESFPEDPSFAVIPLGTVIYSTAKDVCKSSRLKTDFKGDPFDLVDEGKKVLLKHRLSNNKK